jgi:hypothetical protein
VGDGISLMRKQGLIDLVCLDSYWSRKPTPQELVLEMLLALNHGSLGEY